MIARFDHLFAAAFNGGQGSGNNRCAGNLPWVPLEILKAILDHAGEAPGQVLLMCMQEVDRESHCVGKDAQRLHAAIETYQHQGRRQ